MGEAGVKDERLGLAETVDHAVQEADEERGVEAHRAGGVEQDDEAQRLYLSPPPGEIDRRAAVGDAAVDGAAQVEPAPAPPDALAAHEARAHHAGKPRGERVRRRNVVGIDDMAQIGRAQGFDARGAFAAAAAVGRRRFVLIAAPLDMIGKSERLLRHVRLGEPPGRRVACLRRARNDLPLAHVAALPERVENLVEALPIGMRGAEQRAQRRLERRGPDRGRRSQDRERVAGFGQAGLEAVVAQGAGKAGEPATGAVTKVRSLLSVIDGGRRLPRQVHGRGGEHPQRGGCAFFLQPLFADDVE